MKIVVACDSFKESISSTDAGAACVEGIKSVLPEAETDVVPVGDGGEGTVEAMAAALHGRMVECEVTGPLRNPVTAHYCISGDGKTAVMEMAQAAGLALVPADRRNPLDTTTVGVGQMIYDALERGCTTIVMGIGGSATNDGGMGMLSALGVSFRDSDGRDLDPVGISLGRVEVIDLSGLDPRIKDTRIQVACDVDNPLCGPRGAAHVFAPQKGATPEQVELLDQCMRVYADALSTAVGRDVADIPGAGAAGGLGAAFAAVMGAQLKPGIELVLDLLDFDSHLQGADLVITGEGRLDAQTLMGKTPCGVLHRARIHNIPVMAIGGAVCDVPALMRAGFLAVFSIVSGPCTLEDAMETVTTADNIRRTVQQAFRLLTCSIAKS